MKSKITVHIILCGLLTGANVIASETPPLEITKTPSSSKPSSPHTSPQYSPRNNTNDQLSPKSNTPPIAIPQQYSNSPSPSHSPSPTKKSSHQLIKRASQTALHILRSDAAADEEKKLMSLPVHDSIKMEHFFARSEGESSLIDEDGTLNKNVFISEVDRAQLENRYKAQLIITHNQIAVKATHLLDPTGNNAPTVIAEEEQFLVEAALTEEQLKTILEDYLKNKNTVLAFDDSRNLYCINSYVDNSVDKNATDIESQGNENLAAYKEPFIIVSKNNVTYKCLITCIINDENLEEYWVDIEAKKKGKSYLVDSYPIPSEDIYQEVLEIDDNNIIVIDANRQFYRWDSDSTYIPLTYADEDDIVQQPETTEAKTPILTTSPENNSNNNNSIDNGELTEEKKPFAAIIYDQDNKSYQCQLVKYENNKLCIDIYENKNGKLEGIDTVEVPQTEKKYATLRKIADKQWVVINKDQNLYIWDGGLTYTRQLNLDNSITSIVPLEQKISQPNPIIYSYSYFNEKPIVSENVPFYDAISITQQNDVFTITYQDKNENNQLFTITDLMGRLQNTTYLFVQKETDDKLIEIFVIVLPAPEIEKQTDLQPTTPLTPSEPGKTTLTPNTGKGTSYTPTIIGGCAFIAVMLGTLAVLYKHNKLPNITELLNNFLSRVQNFRVTG